MKRTKLISMAENLLRFSQAGKRGADPKKICNKPAGPCTGNFELEIPQGQAGSERVNAAIRYSNRNLECFSRQNKGFSVFHQYDRGAKPLSRHK